MDEPQINGVESVHKTSAEILSELFSSFNAEPPVLDVISDEKSSKKHKKSKKKHKHKEKKHKKKSKHKRSSDSTGSDSELESSRKKRKSKKKHRDRSSSSEKSHLTIVEPEANLKHRNVSNVEVKCATKKEHTDNIKSTVETIKKELTERITITAKKNNHELIIANGLSVNSSKHIETKEKKNSENNKDNHKNDSPEKGSKITIKNLKNSSIYEATIKEVEKKERELAARIEDGELSDSDSGNNSEILNDRILDDSSPKRRQESSRQDRKRKPSEKRTKKDDAKKIKKEKHHSHRYSKEKERRSTKSSRSREDKVYYHRSSHSHRSYSVDRDKYKSSHDRRRSISRNRSRSRDRSSYWDRRRRSKSPVSSSIDKKKLLEIARKNAINMLKSGTLPDALTLGPQAQEKVIAAIKAGGKTIEELTDFCKNLSRKEALGELSSVSSADDAESGSDTEKVFHHPFQIKDKPTSIVMNIKNSTPLPVRTPKEKSTELRMQFPVSSGQLHRKTESEWVPVATKKIEAAPVSVPNIVAIPTPVAKPVFIPSTPISVQSKTIPVPPKSELDIGSIVSQRLNAMRKLQENPHDVQALSQMYRVNKEMDTWAQSRQQPGQFTGSTGAQILSAAQLSSGYQAWARKDQLQNAAPVMGGMGMHLLQKMGWRPGEGLGKEKSGQLEPLLLEVKLDKKGLVAYEEVKSNRRMVRHQKAPTVKTLSGKHPVSLLGEFASKRKLGVPQYQICFECGPDHKKNFVFKVFLNGIEYKPTIASSTKKQAKADAAAICLQQLGVMIS